MATGVLAVFIGKATSAADRQLDHDKTYEATIRLGLRTDTGDVTGTTLETAPVTVGERELRTVLSRFVGDRMQLPPMYSWLLYTSAAADEASNVALRCRLMVTQTR